jgi:DNA-binding MarR family transcriptional regulator
LAKMSMTESISDAHAGSDLGLDFCIRLQRAHATVMRRLDNVLSGLHGLSFADFMILYYLERAPNAKLRRVDLAERLGLTASGVTRSLLPLEKSGLVSRQTDPRDARVGYAALTQSGRQLLSYALTSAHVVAQESIESVPADQIQAVSVFLGRLAGMNSTNS